MCHKEQKGYLKVTRKKQMRSPIIFLLTFSLYLIAMTSPFVKQAKDRSAFSKLSMNLLREVSKKGHEKKRPMLRTATMYAKISQKHVKKSDFTNSAKLGTCVIHVKNWQ